MHELDPHQPQDLAAEQSSLESLVEQILAEARTQGATSAEAGVTTETGLTTTVRLGEVETVEHHRDRGLGVTVYFGHRKGSASTSDFSPEAVRESVRAACGIARYTEEDGCAGLAAPDLLARDVPDLDLFHPWSVDAEQAIRIAQEAEDEARAYDKRITNSEGASISSHRGLYVYGNSNGFLGGYPTTRHSLTCVVIGQEDDSMQRDYWYTVSRDPEALEDAATVGRTAAERTIRRLGAAPLSTREAPVLFAAEVAKGLVGHFLAAVRGASQYRKSSFLLDAVGEKIFPDFVHIHEQPHLQGALGSAPFDSEGVATRSWDLIADGALQGYVLDSYAARKLGMQSTGNAGGVRNLTVDGGDKDLHGLMKEMGTGLFVSELMGQGVNGITGDYSRGASGFWVENGEVACPVEEITIAGNLKEMYRRLIDVGSDMELRGNIRCGSMLIENMTIAGE